MGFSAGGHLSTRLSIDFAKPAYTPVDEHDQQSSRPDCVVLIYPAEEFIRNRAKFEVLDLHGEVAIELVRLGVATCAVEGKRDVYRPLPEEIAK